MAEMKDMYKLVRYIDSNRYEILSHTQTFKAQNEALLALTQDYIKSRKLRKPSESTVAAILVASKEHGYIDWLSSNWTLYVTSIKGRHFIGKKFFIYPAGLVDDSLKAYGRSQRFYTGAVVGGAILAIIEGVIKTLQILIDRRIH
ncbi:MAG: hypothetical protein ABSD10_02450 [Candidatus Saccharimonadales bacterium]